MSCERWRERISLSLYGELDAAESLELEAHLEGCGECRAERQALAATAELLRREGAETERACDVFQERIALSLYGEISGAELEGLERHLAECEECREAHGALGGTVALLRRAEAGPARRRWAWAAAAALLLAAGAVALRSGRPAEDRRPARPAGVPVAAVSAPAPGAALLAEDRLCAAATGDDPAAAIRAVEELGRTGTRRSSRALREALARPATRLAAFRALRGRGELDALADAVPALRDPVLRRDAVAIVAARKTREAFEALLAAGDETCRAACRTFPAEAALPALTAAVADREGRNAAIDLFLTTDGDEMRWALSGLARADAELGRAALARAVSIRDARADRFLMTALADETLRPDAEGAIGGVPLKRLVPAFREALRDASLRLAAARILAQRVAEPAARDLLAAALDDDGVRAIAARPLLAAGDLRAVAPVLASRSDLEALETLPDPGRRRELGRAFGSAKLRAGAVAAVLDRDTALWRELTALLGFADVRGEVAAALARCRAERAVPYLIPWVSPDGAGAQVHGALVALAGVDAGDSPESWSRWWNERVLNP